MSRSFAHLKSLEFLLGSLLTGTICLLVLFSGLLFPGADAIDLSARLLPPFATFGHPFGTDPLGRDVLARVITGGKISLQVGILSVAGAVVVGEPVGLGLAAQYCDQRRRVDDHAGSPVSGS